MAGTLTVVSLLLRVRDTLQDTTGVRWLDAELLRYVNDAQREIINLRPDASSTTANVDLVAGTAQTIPTAGLRLIKVVRNMSAAGGSATGKRAIRIVDREILDTQEPNWHDPTVSGDATHVSVVKHYIFDEDDPRRFYVYPGVLVTNASACFVEIVYSAAPTEITSTSTAIQVDDIYANAIIDFTLRCLVNPGEEVILPDPGFPTYYSAIAYNNIVPVRVPLKEENNFQMDPLDIRERITEKTRLIIINSPHNPTGAVMNSETIREIYKIAEEFD